MACAQRSSTFFRFFKILWEDNLRDEKIRLPNKFTSRYERGLPNPVLLKVPGDGTEWRVHWTKRHGAIWFENGWKEFAEHYSLSMHMVLFKYEVMASQFKVRIFDASTAEIDYPHQVEENIFKLQMQPSYVTGRCIAVPEKFVTKYLKEGPVHLKVGKRTWHMKYKIWSNEFSSSRKHKFQNGWTVFRRENHLEVGDVCVFKLTNRVKVKFTVQIIRRAAD